MKVEYVPLDLKFTKDTPVQHPKYAVNSEGKYQMVNSVGWEAKNEAIQLQLDAIQEECDKVFENIRKGELTLLEYYAVKTGPDFLNRYSAEMTQIGDSWRAFSYQSSKVLKKRLNDALTFDDLGDMLQKTCETEGAFLETI